MKNVNKELKNQCMPPERILALPTWGQKYTVSELQALEKTNMKVKHPACFFHFQWVKGKWFEKCELSILGRKNFLRPTHALTIFLNFYAAGNIFNKKCHVFACEKNEWINFLYGRKKSTFRMSKYKILHSLLELKDMPIIRNQSHWINEFEWYA